MLWVSTTLKDLYVRVNACQSDHSNHTCPTNGETASFLELSAAAVNRDLNYVPGYVP